MTSDNQKTHYILNEIIAKYQNDISLGFKYHLEIPEAILFSSDTKSALYRRNRFLRSTHC